MKKTKFHTILVLITLFNFSIAYSADPTLKVSVSKNPVAPGEKFELMYTFSDIAEQFIQPDLRDFQIHRGPVEQIQTNFNNAGVSQSVVFTYTLSSQQEGVFRITSAQAILKTKKISSGIIDLKVSKSAAEANSIKGDADIKSSVFMELQVNKSIVYAGEPIVVTYKLYSKADLTRYNVETLPTFSGFWSEEIKLPPQPEFKAETRNGVLFHAAEIKKFILFPQQTGELTIPAMQSEVGVRVRVKRDSPQYKNPLDQFFNDPFSNDPFFSDPFFSGFREVPVKTNTGIRKINVKALPKPLPSNYNGAVGEFTLDVQADRKQVKANEAINLKIKISGQGNLRLLEPLTPSLPANIESYEPKISEAISTVSGNLSGSKTFEYLLIPRVSGTFNIPAYEFSYFNPKTGSFNVLKSNNFEINVSPGDPSNASSSGNSSTLSKLNEDIAFIKTDTDELHNSQGSLLKKPLFIVASALPILLLISFFFYQKRKSKNIDTISYKQSKAKIKATKKLKLAEIAIKNQNTEQYWEYLSDGMWGYCIDKFSISQSKLTLEEVILRMKDKKLDDEIIKQFMHVMAEIEKARYAPAQTAGQIKDAYNLALKSLIKIEEELS